MAMLCLMGIQLFVFWTFGGRNEAAAMRPYVKLLQAVVLFQS